MKPDKLLLASANPHKIEELQQMLEPLDIEVIGSKAYPHAEEVIEDQPDLEGNALKKARYWYHLTGIPALSDDTGLEVDALNGAPGVYSARYAGENATYAENVEKLLRELAGKSNRNARFRTVVAFVSEEGEKLFDGVCSGVITDEPKGEKGFGYDPLFLPDGYSETFAELSSEEKNRISHRGRALARFLDMVQGVE